MCYMTGGKVKVPLVIRAPGGAGRRNAAQHSQSWEAIFAHVPGLKVVAPSTPHDAKGLLKTAIRDDNPVMFFEHKMLYGAASPGGKAKTAVDDLGESFKPVPRSTANPLLPVCPRLRGRVGLGALHGHFFRADLARDGTGCDYWRIPARCGASQRHFHGLSTGRAEPGAGGTRALRRVALSRSA